MSLLTFRFGRNTILAEVVVNDYNLFAKLIPYMTSIYINQYTVEKLINGRT